MERVGAVVVFVFVFGFVLSFALGASGCAASLEASLRDAKAELDAGHRACAFGRVELLRRARVESESGRQAFHRAFDHVFLVGPPLPPRDQAADKALEAALPSEHRPARRRALEA